MVVFAHVGDASDVVVGVVHAVPVEHRHGVAAFLPVGDAVEERSGGYHVAVAVGLAGERAGIGDEFAFLQVVGLVVGLEPAIKLFGPHAVAPSRIRHGLCGFRPGR